jgi:hypothetical protein
MEGRAESTWILLYLLIGDCQLFVESAFGLVPPFTFMAFFY